MKHLVLSFQLLATFLIASSAMAGVKIVCVGDSITYGHGVWPDKSYPSVLQSRLGGAYTVLNLGLNGTCVLTKGDNPYIGHTQIITATNSLPDIIVLMLGTNDGKPNNWANKAAFTNDFEAILERLLAGPSHPRVFVCAPCPVLTAGENFAIDAATINEQIVPAVRRIAAARGVPLIDVNARMTGHPEWLGEAVHPNAAGYAQIADVVYASIIGPRIALTPGISSNSTAEIVECGAVPPAESKSIRFTITNPGNAALSLTGTPAIAFSGLAAADFSVPAAPMSPIAPGSITTFDVRFSPSVYGDRSCMMTILNNEAAQPALCIPLHGVGSATNDAVTNQITIASAWRYHKGTSEASTPINAWRMSAFDASAWPVGAMPFWYGDGANGTLLTDMAGSYATFYVRQNVVVSNPAALTELILSVDYDDAFAVWVNGHLLKAVGMPDPPLHDSITTNNHECSVSPDSERGAVDISRHPASAFLVAGTNIIAAMAFNRGLASSDCYLNLNLSVVSAGLSTTSQL